MNVKYFCISVFSIQNEVNRVDTYFATAVPNFKFKSIFLMNKNTLD